MTPDGSSLSGAARRTTVVVIGGPTASGKSALALALAAARNGVVINGDSMQVYDGLPLLTAQPGAADRAKAPHRLYGALAPDDPCTAARWRGLALAEIAAAENAGQLPIVAGGTGFYLRTLMRGISPIPDVPPAVRAEMAALQKKTGNPGFHALLREKDPVMAARLHPGNTQRLIRAMEVLAHTGKSLAAWQALPPEGPPTHLRFVFATLLPPRAQLYRQCDARFEKMLAAGALAEVAAFTAAYPQATREAVALKNALGYPELARHLAGKMTRAEAVAAAQAATRHYAKRQVTWFRHQMTPDVVLDAADNAQALMEAIERKEAAS